MVHLPIKQKRFVYIIDELNKMDRIGQILELTRFLVYKKDFKLSNKNRSEYKLSSKEEEIYNLCKPYIEKIYKHNLDYLIRGDKVGEYTATIELYKAAQLLEKMDEVLEIIKEKIDKRYKVHFVHYDFINLLKRKGEE